MATESLLSGDITVYFAGDAAGDKQIKWTGSTATTATRTVNELYTALQDLFDNNTLGVGDYIAKSFGIPMKAVTPRVYDIGLIETGDDDPWFIDQATIEHLTGGSIQTIGWTRTVGSATGIVCVPITNVDIVIGDVGNTITHADGDSGTLLDFEDSDYGTYLWIRPDSNAAGNNFDSTSGTLTCNAHTATQTAAANDGEKRWNNIATIGAIESATDIEVAQDQTLLTKYWPAGFLDRLFLITDLSTDPFGTIDGQYFTFFARKENTLYDNFLIQTDEGRNVVPLATAPDLNNESPSLTSIAGFSITFGPATADINDDTTNENYSITVNCGGATLANAYRYLQYLTRDGDTTLRAGVEGQQYIGIDHYIQYASITGTINVGDEVTGSSSGATGYVASVNTTDTYVMLHSSQGTFTATENLTIGGNSINNISSIEIVQPKKATPFGNFAGGRFFGARGVLVTNFTATNNYELIDDQGNSLEPPTTRTFALTGMKDGTEVRIFKTADSSAIAGIEDMTGGVGTSPDNGDGTVTITGSTDNNTFTFSWVYQDAPTSGSDVPIFIAILNNEYEYISLTGLSLENSDSSIPVQQRFDRNFSDP